MKIKQGFALSILALSIINNCFAMDDGLYGNIEIFNKTGSPIKITFTEQTQTSSGVRSVDMIENVTLDKDSTLEGHFKASANYTLYVEELRGGISGKFNIVGVTSNNNIFVAITKSSSFGFNVTPYAEGIIKKTSRRGRPAKGNIKEKNIKAIQRQ